MELWYRTAPAGRVAPNTGRVVDVGTWPIASGQSVWVVARAESADGQVVERRIEASWQVNAGPDSHWRAELPAFTDGTRVSYHAEAAFPGGHMTLAKRSFTVGPRLHLALVWHQHQPLYRDLTQRDPRGSYTQPWVRLHALRDYYGMAALVAEQPAVHVTINLTPILLWQLADYVERGATDRALELTRTPAETMTALERELVAATFFDADWHHQVLRHPRYAELFAARQARQPFDMQDLRDLQMWFNLAWFAPEFREGEVALPTGDVASVRRFVDRQRGFTHDDIEAMVAEQYKVLRAIVPLHRALQEAGQIEVSTTPFAHPILPLLVDTDRATIDRTGASHPRRFAWPEDADAHVRLAVRTYADAFGRSPRGMWPAEGAVASFVIPHFVRHGVRWIASDRGVLARSGRWGYPADDPERYAQPWRAMDDTGTIAPPSPGAVSVFFRDGVLSDRIGFVYQHERDPAAAAADFVARLRVVADGIREDEDRVLTVVLDGENAWGAYRDDGRPFLRALYAALAAASDIRTVTFSEYLDGDAKSSVRPHPIASQPVVHDLFAGSWIDEFGSAPGVDHGTWIGEGEENQAWEMLGAVRADVARVEPPSEHMTATWLALYAAEGSDWFWWFGADQESGSDDTFDSLFRTHLRAVYDTLGRAVPAALTRHIVPQPSTWRFTAPVDELQPSDALHILTNCPGELTWWVDDAPARVAALRPAGGVMAGHGAHGIVIGPFEEAARDVRFRFRCMHAGCDGRGACCNAGVQHVRLLSAIELPAV
jgi:alpha-amylase/alpha-mannosidase (GH57 family)